MKHKVCAPHDSDSVYYQYTFFARHKRMPTHSDAVAHCSPGMQQVWKKLMRQILRDRGQALPTDLAEATPAT